MLNKIEQEKKQIPDCIIYTWSLEKSNNQNHRNREQNECGQETGEQRKGDFGSGVQTISYKSPKLICLWVAVTDNTDFHAKCLMRKKALNFIHTTQNGINMAAYVDELHVAGLLYPIYR